MRISFAGPLFKLDPVVVRFNVPGTYDFDKTLYPGFTNFELIVIGGGGGHGGGLQGTDPSNEDWDVINFGGQGGGGGSHRIKGLLESLDDVTSVIVGAAGANGDDGGDDPDASTPGEDGEASYFGDSGIMAAGGGGGYPSKTLSYIENQLADGGKGGLGGTDSPGTGAAGGICGLNNDPEFTEENHHTPGTPGEDGGITLVSGGTIGSGGGGGAGGSLRHDETGWHIQPPIPTRGGKGSWSLDEDITAPGGGPEVYLSEDDDSINAKPGKAGGARITPIDGSRIVSYGDSEKDGLVAIRLTVE